MQCCKLQCSVKYGKIEQKVQLEHFYNILLFTNINCTFCYNISTVCISNMKIKDHKIAQINETLFSDSLYKYTDKYYK